MLTVDEQLDQALARVKSLEADAQASANLLSEAAANNERLSAQLTEAAAQQERLDADLLAAHQAVEALTKQKGELEGRVTELVSLNTQLQACEQDLELRASKRAAEIVAATGTTAPAPVTPKGDQQTEDLVARFKAISDPAGQTAFWRTLTPQQQAQILNLK